MCFKYEEYKHKLVKLKSAFTEPQDCSLTNLTDKFVGTIDYIFYEESPNFFVKSLMSLPQENELRSETALPNSIFPSDHLPLICTFGLSLN